MDPVLERLDRIEEKLDRALAPRDAISPEEAMKLTGCKSLSAQYRWFKTYGLRPYIKGKYRTTDIRHKIAMLTYSPRL